MRRSAQAALAVVVAALGLGAQSPAPLAERLAAADRLYAQGDGRGALGGYQAVLARDALNYEAAWKAARTAIDLGEFERDATERARLYDEASAYGLTATQADSVGVAGYFQYARATGRLAQSLGVRDRIHVAEKVRALSLKALALSPEHGGALHILGVWNAEIMRLNGISRFIAKSFLGADVFGAAGWDSAVTYLRRSVASEPTRIVHHLDLGRVYADIGRADAARAEFEWIARAPTADYNDANYKRQAAEALRGLK